MTQIALTDAVFRFHQGRDEVAALAVGALDLGSHACVVLFDTADQHWVVEVDAQGQLAEVIGGPVTGIVAIALVIQTLIGTAPPTAKEGCPCAA